MISALVLIRHIWIKERNIETTNLEEKSICILEEQNPSQSSIMPEIIMNHYYDHESAYYKAKFEIKTHYGALSLYTVLKF